MTAERQKRYTAVAIALHWTIAFAIIGMIALGWIMGDMEDRAQAFALIQLHKSIGISILLLTVARVIWRLMNPPPPEPPMPVWQKRLAWGVHVGLYVMMVAMPLTGWIMVSASPTGIGTRLFDAVPWPHIPGLPDLSREAKVAFHEPIEFVHSKLAWVTIVLLALHVAGALKHQFVDRDGLLARMIPGVFGRTAGPGEPGRGGAIAFGTAAALLVAGVGYALASGQAPAAGGPPASSEQADAATAPAWSVDPTQSSIVFRSSYMGRPFEGRFSNWTSDIRFDSDNLESSTVRVVIPTAQASTGEAYFDENVVEGDWFDSRTHANAVYEVAPGGILRNSDGTYEAAGVLTLKGESYPLRLPFTLEIEGDTARMHAEVVVKRTQLGVGRDTLTSEDGDAEWVADDVGLVIDVVARRQ